MTPEGALLEVLARVGAGGEVFVTEHGLTQWPPGAVKALKAQKLNTKASPAVSAVCPGCEDGCTLPVETILGPSGTPAFFVMCDRRDDTNRVAITADQLTQWQMSETSVAKFIGKCLSARWNGKTASTGDALQIGIVKSTKKSQMLCLRSEKELMLMAGSSELPLAEVVTFAEDLYALDLLAIEQLVNNSSTSDARYTPSNAKREARKLDTKAKYESWNKEYRKLKKKNPGGSDTWCAMQIFKMDIGDNKSVDTIRKNMK